MKISCATTQFPVLYFCGPHTKLHGVRSLSKHYHLRIDPKLVHGNFEIRQILCACIACTNMLDKTWAYGVDPTKKTCYRPFEDCTYWTTLGSLNNCNITDFTNKTTSGDEFDVVHKIVLDVISYNMPSLGQLIKYVAINTEESTTTGFIFLLVGITTPFFGSVLLDIVEPSST